MILQTTSSQHHFSQPTVSLGCIISELPTFQRWALCLAAVCSGFIYPHSNSKLDASEQHTADGGDLQEMLIHSLEKKSFPTMFSKLHAWNCFRPTPTFQVHSRSAHWKSKQWLQGRWQPTISTMMTLETKPLSPCYTLTPHSAIQPPVQAPARGETTLGRQPGWGSGWRWGHPIAQLHCCTLQSNNMKKMLNFILPIKQIAESDIKLYMCVCVFMFTHACAKY